MIDSADINYFTNNIKRDGEKSMCFLEGVILDIICSNLSPASWGSEISGH